MVASEVKKLAQDTRSSLSRTHASIGGMENSLASLGTNIQETRGQLVQAGEGYSGIVTQIEQMFTKLETITGVLAELEGFVRERSAELAGVMGEIDKLKRIG